MLRHMATTLDARGGIRTRTLRRAALFKSAASTSWATRADGANLREVGRERDLLRRAAFAVLPRLVGDAVAPVVRLGAAEGDQRDAPLAAVHQPPAHVRRDPRELAGAQLALLALDGQGQRPLEHEVDLLLALVAVDAPLLARPEHDQVHAERADPELAAQGDE